MFDWFHSDYPCLNVLLDFKHVTWPVALSTFPNSYGMVVKLSLILLLTGLTLFSVYLYSKSLEYVKNHPPMLFVDGCENDSSRLVVHWTFENILNRQILDNPGRDTIGLLGSLVDNHRCFFPIPHQLRDFAIPKIVDGVNGNALKFNGRNWADAGNTMCLAVDKFTVACWVWRNNTPPPKKGDWLVPTIAAKSNWPGSGWWLCTEPNTNNLDMAVSSGEKQVHIHSAFEIPSEEWHHFAVTVDNQKQEISFFIDGALFGEKHIDVPRWLINYDQNLYVGDYDGTARWPWFGKISDFYFFKDILSPEEILAIYKKAKR